MDRTLLNNTMMKTFGQGIIDGFCQGNKSRKSRSNAGKRSCLRSEMAPLRSRPLAGCTHSQRPGVNRSSFVKAEYAELITSILQSRKSSHRSQLPTKSCRGIGRTLSSTEAGGPRMPPICCTCLPADARWLPPYPPSLAMLHHLSPLPLCSPFPATSFVSQIFICISCL